MPDLEEVLGDYFRLLPTWSEEEADPQQQVWQKFHDDLDGMLSDLGKLRMYHADRANHTRTRVEQTGRMAKAENYWNQAYELLEGLLAQILVVADAVPVSEFLPRAFLGARGCKTSPRASCSCATYHDMEVFGQGADGCGQSSQ